ncbi:hypothetical protein HYFRA_00004334 [Hymenoscyphus fraxineus]|uniref:Mitochondrial large ribosomal subunit n=1 Tax=Hymenoscyphus fraxineus TaxID=746836 RepID=A0A9N9PKK3_9HELO|nr:hypothetical protein HYFRA_00004334 [Hymenoscyphus fraxineus]
MSLHLPIRRAVRSASALTSSQPSINFLVPRSQRRTLFGWKGWGKGTKEKADPTSRLENPIEKLGPKDLKDAISKDAHKPKAGLSNSVFGDDSAGGDYVPPKEGLQRHLVRQALDPDPSSRIRWETRMVQREVLKRGRLTRKQELRRQEREQISKSQPFKTSVKKLVPLAKQITGKTVEDAIIQMRFSVKKAAKDVKEHLEHAKNEAITRRAMGLGAVQGVKVTPMFIQTKDKRSVRVDDPTRMYIEQAWVGRSTYGTTPDSRARGRVYMMKNPTTMLTVVLKEEKTRIRQHEERQEKIRNRKVWHQLPNRPITAQRQHYSW